MRHTSQAPEAIRFVMEATGVYHARLVCALYEAGAEVVVANPAQVRYAERFGVRTKHDRKDAMILARFGATQGPLLSALRLKRYGSWKNVSLP